MTTTVSIHCHVSQTKELHTCIILIRDRCTKRHQMILNSKRGKIPIYMLSVSPSPKYHSISPYDQQFSGYCRPFWYKCTKWPQNDLEHYEVKGTGYTSYKCPPTQKLQSFLSHFCFTASSFRVISRFETHWITPKSPWTLRGHIKATHICPTIATKSQISFGFCSKASRFPAKDHFETSALNDPNMKHGEFLEKVWL